MPGASSWTTAGKKNTRTKSYPRKPPSEKSPAAVASSSGPPAASPRPSSGPSPASENTWPIPKSSHVLTLGVAAYARPAFADNFRANAFFIGNSLRDAVSECRADYTPVFLSQVPGLFRTRRIPIDVALICVSPPDKHGYCSYGVSVDITKTATECAKLVIAQVNHHMPRTAGDCFIHVNDIDYLVPHDEPLLEWPFEEDTDDVVTRIGANVARLIENGSTLQMGIGRIPDAVLSCLQDKRDLGIHTEMFSDGILDLVETGVVTGKYKTLHKGKIVGSFAAGSQRLYEFLDNNPVIEMHPSEYTNNCFTIAQHDNMVAINSALEVDLTGQICADSIGTSFFSGLGGHADFMRGAALAKRGKAIIAVPSTANVANERVSPNHPRPARRRRRYHHPRRRPIRRYRIRHRLPPRPNHARTRHGPYRHRSPPTSDPTCSTPPNDEKWST